MLARPPNQVQRNRMAGIGDSLLSDFNRNHFEKQDIVGRAAQRLPAHAGLSVDARGHRWPHDPAGGGYRYVTYRVSGLRRRSASPDPCPAARLTGISPASAEHDPQPMRT